MTEYTREELVESDKINMAIDDLMDAVIEIGLTITESERERDGPMNSLLIAEGILGRIIAAFSKAYGGGKQEGLDELLAISHRHVRALAQCSWDRLTKAEAEGVKFDDDDTAPDA